MHSDYINYVIHRNGTVHIRASAKSKTVRSGPVTLFILSVQFGPGLSYTLLSRSYL